WRAIEEGADDAEAHDGLALILIAQDRDEEAAEHALTAVGLRHDFPRAHYHLGVALARLGRAGPAAVALERALALQPGSVAVHRWLALVREALGEGAKAAAHRQWILRLSVAAVEAEARSHARPRP